MYGQHRQESSAAACLVCISLRQACLAAQLLHLLLQLLCCGRRRSVAGSRQLRQPFLQHLHSLQGRAALAAVFMQLLHSRQLRLHLPQL